MERTLLMVKPDATERNLTGEIVHRLEAEGFRLRAIRALRLRRAEAESFYAVHRERPFYADLVEYMISGTVVPQPGLLTPIAGGATAPKVRDTIFRAATRSRPGELPRTSTIARKPVLIKRTERFGGRAGQLVAARYPVRVTEAGKLIRQPQRPPSPLELPTTMPIDTASPCRILNPDNFSIACPIVWPKLSVFLRPNSCSSFSMISDLILEFLYTSSDKVSMFLLKIWERFFSRKLNMPRSLITECLITSPIPEINSFSGKVFRKLMF